MDDAWRFRSIPDHQNCPVCCVSHYPFCSSPPAFFGDDRRRFPYDIRPPTFHRSFYDTSTHSPFPPLPRSLFHPPPFLLEEIRERESFPKRMRVEDPAIGAFSLFQSFNRSFLSDDERRLNLIRDHGKQDISPSQEERRQITRGYLMDRHRVECLGSQFGSDGIDVDFSESAFGHPNGPESVFGHRNGHFQASKAYEGYRNELIPNLEMEDRSWSNERKDFDRVELEADRRGMFNSQMADYSHASQVSRFHGSDETLDGSENFVLSAQGESSSNGSWRLASYSSIDDNALRVGSFHKQQQDQPMVSSSRLLPKQPLHPHIDSFGTVPYHRDHATQTQLESISEFYERKGEMMGASFELRPTIPDEFHKPSDAQACQAPLQLGHHTSKQAGCTPLADKVNHVIGTYLPGKGHTSRSYSPIPPQPLFPIQTEATLSAPQVTSSVSAMVSIVSPVVVDTSTKRPLSAYGSKVLPQDVLYSESPVQASDRFDEASPFISQPSLNLEERGPSISAKYSGKERPAYVDASHLFKQPHRASRPYHIVIILRGLPGSGKSYLAKALRDIEVENGGSAPRIHAMDDYFMIEVEKKVEDNEGFKSSGSVRSKKQVTKKVIEYCYEPEMEEAYRSSMLKAFKKTLDDGIFTFVIVDDRNLRVADFAQFWGIAKRSGYEVYILEATYKDPAGCAARNIHGFKLDEIQRMAKQWEGAPPLYLHLDIQSLFGGDDLDEQHIQEVDMDADDTRDGEANHSQETDDCKSTELKLLDHLSDHGSTKLGKRWNTEEEEEEFAPVNNELQKSKWSKNLDVNCSKSSKGNTSALSGLIQAYGKGVKCVRWGDRDETIGFSIGAIKKHVSSLIIGPGAGYNLDSNPLSEVDPDGEATGKISNESKRLFNEQLRAERESFRAVFDRRRQRIVGLWDADDE